jgi:poly [ADP-ribose] polymerase 2/3/4
MATLVKDARYILTNIENNNNKFWNALLFDDGTCETQWGRVGEDGQTKRFPGAGENFFNSKCREKQGKGYQPQKTLNNSAAAKSVESSRLADVAAEQIETNSPETLTLVSYLAKINVHRILEATSLHYDTSRGTFSTPLGIVTADGLSEARTLLTDIADYVVAQDYTHRCFIQKLNDYLMLIPQNIGRGRPDPAALFPDVEAVRKQNGLLDSLEASLQMILSQPEEDAPEAPPIPRLFEAKLNLIEDVFEISRIERKYRETNQSIHSCHHLNVKRVFSMEIASMRRDFEEAGQAVGNVQELWHGTRASNLLSILKSGFYIPPSNAPHVTGRMFGNGVYFSDQSTKALNYAYGYWSGTREDKCFMFLCDVAMGKSYTPPAPSSALPMPGYDSTFGCRCRATTARSQRQGRAVF